METDKPVPKPMEVPTRRFASTRGSTTLTGSVSSICLICITGPLEKTSLCKDNWKTNVVLETLSGLEKSYYKYPSRGRHVGDWRGGGEGKNLLRGWKNQAEPDGTAG